MQTHIIDVPPELCLGQKRKWPIDFGKKQRREWLIDDSTLEMIWSSFFSSYTSLRATWLRKWGAGSFPNSFKQKTSLHQLHMEVASEALLRKTLSAFGTQIPPGGHSIQEENRACCLGGQVGLWKVESGGPRQRASLCMGSRNLGRSVSKGRNTG